MHFGNIFVIFVWFGVARWERVSRPMVLMWKCCLNAVAVGVRNITKTYIFKWFLCFCLSTNFMTSGVVLSIILVSCVSLGRTFSDF